MKLFLVSEVRISEEIYEEKEIVKNLYNKLKDEIIKKAEKDNVDISNAFFINGLRKDQDYYYLKCNCYLTVNENEVIFKIGNYDSLDTTKEDIYKIIERDFPHFIGEEKQLAIDTLYRIFNNIDKISKN